MLTNKISTYRDSVLARPYCILLWNAWNMDCIFRYVPYNFTFLTLDFQTLANKSFYIKEIDFSLWIVHYILFLQEKYRYIILSFGLRNSFWLICQVFAFQKHPLLRPVGSIDKHVIFHTQIHNSLGSVKVMKSQNEYMIPSHCPKYKHWGKYNRR